MPRPRLLSSERDPSTLMFESPLVKIGDFQCPLTHSCFADSGPTDDYCFVFPRSAAWIAHEGSLPFVADSAVVPLYNAGHPYRRTPIRPEGDRTDWFSVSPSLLREMLVERDPFAAEADQRLFRFDFARADGTIFLGQRGIVNHIRDHKTADTLYVEESVIAVLEAVLNSLYGRDVQASNISRRQRDLAEAARAQLNHTFSEAGGLVALARSVDASVFHLCRIFRQYMGLTIHQYRAELRLRRSLELLSDGTDDILTIAVELGYSGHSHFTNAFHRAFGTTPSEFRSGSRIGNAALTRAGDELRGAALARVSGRSALNV